MLSMGKNRTTLRVSHAKKSGTTSVCVDLKYTACEASARFKMMPSACVCVFVFKVGVVGSVLFD